MSFLQKLKAYFGYGILEIDVQLNSTTIDRHQPIVQGELVITAKTDDFIEKITMKVEEVWRKKDVNGNPVNENFRLGDLEFEIQKNIAAGETFTTNFCLGLDLVKSISDRMRDQGGVIGAMGKMSSLLQSEKSNFWLDTTVHVKSASFEPNKCVELFLN